MACGAKEDRIKRIADTTYDQAQNNRSLLIKRGYFREAQSGDLTVYSGALPVPTERMRSLSALIGDVQNIGTMGTALQTRLAHVSFELWLDEMAHPLW